MAMIPALGWNWALALATSEGGLRYDPYLAFNFVVELDGLLVGGFTDVSGLESEVEVEEYREGGRNGFVHKLPRQTTYPNLILSHGLTDIDTLWNWYHNVTQGIVKRKRGTIMLLDRQRLPVVWWDFRNAYPVKWSGPEFRANAAETAVEKVELVHEGLTKSRGSQALSLVRGGAQMGGFTGF